MLARAQAEGWVLIAPTLQYGDWRNPTAVAGEDVTLVEQLRKWIERLPKDTGINVESKAMMYGFSRGAQLAHRFTLVHPELVRTAVILGAGTYTLPLEAIELNGAKAALTWPYGCADFATRFGRKLNPDQLKTVPFLVGVGELDNNPADLPRQWDQYEGTNRVERARAFALALSNIGVPTRFMVFPRHGHAVGGIQRTAALDYLSVVLYRDDEPNPPFDRPIRVEANVRMADVNQVY
jgi:pimeloyl-ACP methyl ester carboxylesterase